MKRMILAPGWSGSAARAPRQEQLNSQARNAAEGAGDDRDRRPSSRSLEQGQECVRTSPVTPGT